MAARAASVAAAPRADHEDLVLSDEVAPSSQPRRSPRIRDGASRPDRRHRRRFRRGPASRSTAYSRIFRASDSAAGSASVRPVTSSWQNSTMPLPFAVLQQRAVLEAEAAVEDRQEIAASGLLDQDRSHVAAIPAAPDARHRDVAPLDRRAISRTHLVIEPRRQDRGLAAPVVQVLRGDPGHVSGWSAAGGRPASGRIPSRGTRVASPAPPRSARRRRP